MSRSRARADDAVARMRTTRARVVQTTRDSLASDDARCVVGTCLLPSKLQTTRESLVTASRVLPPPPLRRSEVVVRRCGYATGASADASLEAIRLADEKTLLTMLESTIDTHNKATRKALN